MLGSSVFDVTVECVPNVVNPDADLNRVLRGLNSQL